MRKAMLWLGGSILLLGNLHHVLNTLNTVVIDLIRLCGNVDKLLSALDTIARHLP